MDEKRQTMGTAFDCRVTSPEAQKKIPIGLAEDKWNERYYNHKKSFNHKRYSHETALSSYLFASKGNF